MAMRCAFLLPAVVLLGTFDVGSSALVSSEQGGMMKMTARNVKMTNRFLRYQAGTNGAESSALTKLVQRAAHLAAGTLKVDVHPMSAFKLLGLNMAGVKLDGNPSWLQWLKLTNAYMEKNPKSGFKVHSTYAFLYRQTSEAELPVLLQNLKEASGVGKLVSELRRFQFGVWEGKEFKPNQVAKSVFKIDDVSKLSKDDPRVRAIEDYAKYLVREEELKKLINYVERPQVWYYCCSLSRIKLRRTMLIKTQRSRVLYLHLVG
uniref:Avh441 n=1 Tax=Phytophthora sojae TaxID=67593 RepID=G1FT97_PHYSO|nr:Avh441 [Phytophthora sojae]